VVIERDGEHLFSGPMRGVASSGPRTEGAVTVTFEDDFRLLSRVLGWPLPNSPVTSQGVKSDVRTGPAETVAKGFITANAMVRLALPVIVEPTHGWGDTVTVDSRMAVLADKLTPVLEASKVGLRVRQSGTSLLVEAYQPRVYPRTLSEDGGTVTRWSYTYEGYTATRTVIGGPLENTDRQFIERIDVPRETLYNDVIEVFTDAQSADNVAAMDAAGVTALRETAAKSGFSIELSETPTFRYGTNGVKVGDMVTVDISGETITDILREATLSWNREEGFTVTQTVGRESTTDRKIADLFLKLARGMRDLRTR
jgi:hypothetical protein